MVAKMMDEDCGGNREARITGLHFAFGMRHLPLSVWLRRPSVKFGWEKAAASGQTARSIIRSYAPRGGVVRKGGGNIPISALGRKPFVASRREGGSLQTAQRMSLARYPGLRPHFAGSPRRSPFYTRLTPDNRCLLPAFHDFDFFFAEAVQFINNLVDLFVGGLDLALQGDFGVADLGGGELLMQAEHAFDQHVK